MMYVEYLIKFQTLNFDILGKKKLRTDHQVKGELEQHTNFF